MGSKCHAHVAPGHCTIAQIRQALGSDDTSGLRLGWRALLPFRPDVAAELRRDMVENAYTWHVPTPEELGDVFGDPDMSWVILEGGFGEIAAVLDRGEVWVVYSAADSLPQTLVVGMSFD